MASRKSIVLVSQWTTIFLLFLSISTIQVVNGRSLSYRMKASEKNACFYANVDPAVDLKEANIQFYFAASDAKGAELAFVDAVVSGPTGIVAHNEKRQSHAEVNVKPNMPGEYSLCISHNGHPTDKNLDIDVTIPLPVHMENGTAVIMDDATQKLNDAMIKLQRELGDIVHTLRYIKSRENRNLLTVSNMSLWVFWISVFEVLLILGMSALQVTILRTFFSGNRAHQKMGI